MENTISHNITILKNNSVLEEKLFQLQNNNKEFNLQCKKIISQIESIAKNMGSSELKIGACGDDASVMDNVLWQVMHLMKNRRCFSYYYSIFTLITKCLELQNDYIPRQELIQYFIECFEYNLYLTTHPSDAVSFAMHPIYVVQAMKTLHALLAKVTEFSEIKQTTLTQQVQMFINETLKKIVHGRNWLPVYIKGVNNYIERIRIALFNKEIINTIDGADFPECGVSNWEAGDVLLLNTKICNASTLQWYEENELIDYKRYLIHVLQESITLFKDDLRNNELSGTARDPVFFFRGLATLSFDETIGSHYQTTVLKMIKQFFPKTIRPEESIAYQNCIEVCQNILTTSHSVIVKLCAAETLKVICSAWTGNELNMNEVISVMQFSANEAKHLSTSQSIIEIALNMAIQYGPEHINVVVCKELLHCVHAFYSQFPKDISELVNQLEGKFSIANKSYFSSLSLFWGGLSAMVFPLALNIGDEKNRDIYILTDVTPLMDKKDR